MTSPPLVFAEIEAGLSASPIPVWVMEPESLKGLWVNAAGLEFWRSDDTKELTNRQMKTTAPQKVFERISRVIAKVLAGNIVAEEWAFYPKGVPTMVMLHMRPVIWRDGTLRVMNQAVPLQPDDSPPLRRTLSMARHTPVSIAFVDAAGTIYSQNPASQLEFGETSSWLEWLADPDQGRRLIQDVLPANMVDLEVPVLTMKGRRIHAIQALGLRDPVSGDFGVLVHHLDVTERVAAERLVQKQLKILQEQQREILALSTPMLDVGARTLALPIIGRIDETRAREISARLLSTIVDRGIEHVILDITGVVSLEVESAAFLRRIVDAIRLLGARPILTGIRGDLATFLATSDVDLSGILIKRSLADGLDIRRRK